MNNRAIHPFGSGPFFRFINTRSNISSNGKMKEEAKSFTDISRGSACLSQQNSSGGKEEERRGEEKRAFDFLLRSKVSNFHVATEDLSSTITLKRVKTRQLEQNGVWLQKYSCFCRTAVEDNRRPSSDCTAFKADETSHSFYPIEFQQHFSKIILKKNSKCGF